MVDFPASYVSFPECNLYNDPCVKGHVWGRKFPWFSPPSPGDLSLKRVPPGHSAAQPVNWLAALVPASSTKPQPTMGKGWNTSKIPFIREGWGETGETSYQLVVEPPIWKRIISPGRGFESNGETYCRWFVRNPARKPVEVGSLSHYLQGLKYLNIHSRRLGWDIYVVFKMWGTYGWWFRNPTITTWDGAKTV